MRIAVDANGADLGPAEVAAGAAIAVRQGVTPVLYGPASEIGEVAAGVEVVDAPVSIAKAAEPVSAVRQTPEASIVQAAKAVAAGDCEAFVAGGTTGAALGAGLFNIKRASGIYRPALALPLPVPNHPVTLVDVRANIECRPEHLLQFAHMGAALVQTVLNVENPRVGLLSNGEEDTKGTPMYQEAFALLRESQGLNFDGNLDGTQVVDGTADVVVHDGFTGNITLKLIEGVSQMTMGAIRDRAMSSARAKLGGLLLKPALRGLRDEIDPEGPGGAYRLGLRRVGVVPHGRFPRYGISQAILRAARGTSGDVVGRTHAALAAAGALRSAPGGAGANI